MKRNLKIAIAFATLAGIAGTAAVAADRPGRDGMRGFGMMTFGSADADSSGDVTLDEFTAAVTGRLGKVDADDDGTMTVEEVAAAIERMRNQRRAERIINRLDADNDGVLTTAEFDAAQGRIFARMDRNDDGKVEKSEMPRRMRGEHRGGRHDDDR